MAERDLPHIVVREPAAAEPYARPPRKMKKKVLPFPEDRAGHGAGLATQMQEAEAAGLARRSQLIEVHGAVPGIHLVFESFPGIELALERLDPRQGRLHPELVSVHEVDVEGEIVERATVFVPDGTLGYFLKRLNQYTDTASDDKPRHRELVDRVKSIGLASLREMWTDSPSGFPAGKGSVWWEIWLRKRDGQEIERLRGFCETAGANLGRQYLAFPDRVVALVHATPKQLSGALDVLDDLAELRQPRELAEVIASQSAEDHAAWSEQLAGRTAPPSDDAPAACILDTGVHQPHPLLAGSLGVDDCHACDPTWKVEDHHGHGTEMAGLALYGDLGAAVLDANPIRLRTRLESVKILPPKGANPPELYGALTATATSLVEIQAPTRRRVLSMSVTADAATDAPPSEGSASLGQPSSWSASVDALAAGLTVDVGSEGLVFLDESEEAARRLFVVATGNVRSIETDHLARSDVEAIEDPGQAWNALTVGAFTERDSLASAPADFAGWGTLAPQGELSPFSRTSVSFSRSWPVKPDVLFEGGNAAVSPAGTSFDTPDVLQLLTTKAPLTDQRLLTVTNATSAATAQAAHLASMISADYPGLWPETIRALVVHSAEWTPAMRNRIDPAGTRTARAALFRRYGMGVPSLARATRSASDALTLIVQDVIHPFDGAGRMREMHIHDLPWPADVLSELGSADVRLRVTLSYFVEPNPGRRGWVRRYTYPSHGLRFEVRRPTESTDDFRKRLNQKALAEEESRPKSESDSPEWML
jgi:hypothetical protein